MQYSEYCLSDGLMQETYPQIPPIWFSESEDISISVIIEKLSDTSEKNYNVSSIYLTMIKC